MQIDSSPPSTVSPVLTKLNAQIEACYSEMFLSAKKYVEPQTCNISAYAFHSGSSKQVVRLLHLDHLALTCTDEGVKIKAKSEFTHHLETEYLSTYISVCCGCVV